MHLLFHHRVKKNYNGDNYVDDHEIMDGMLNVNTGITIVTFNEKTLTAEFSTHTKAPSFVLSFKPIQILPSSVHRS